MWLLSKSSRLVACVNSCKTSLQVALRPCQNLTCRIGKTSESATGAIFVRVALAARRIGIAVVSAKILMCASAVTTLTRKRQNNGLCMSTLAGGR